MKLALNEMMVCRCVWHGQSRLKNWCTSNLCNLCLSHSLISVCPCSATYLSAFHYQTKRSLINYFLHFRVNLYFSCNSISFYIVLPGKPFIFLRCMCSSPPLSPLLIGSISSATNCFVSMSVLMNVLVYKYIYVLFSFVVPPEITTNPLSQEVVESNGVTLFCNATGNPQPIIAWTKQGSNTVLSTSETLTLTHLMRGDNGAVYICKAQNNVGSAEANATIAVLCEQID